MTLTVDIFNVNALNINLTNVHRHVCTFYSKDFFLGIILNNPWNITEKKKYSTFNLFKEKKIIVKEIFKFLESLANKILWLSFYSTRNLQRFLKIN